MRIKTHNAICLTLLTIASATVGASSASFSDAASSHLETRLFDSHTPRFILRRRSLLASSDSSESSLSSRQFGDLFGGGSDSTGSSSSTSSSPSSGSGTGSSTGTGSNTGSTGTANGSSSSSTSSSSSPSSSSSTSAGPSTTASATSESSTRQAAATTTSARTTPTSEAPATTSVTSVTDAAGQTTVVTSVVAASTTSAAAASATTGATDSSDSGNHTPLIIGVSVVGGVALIGGIAFLLFKFSGKRTGFQDGDADIKWPELKHNDEDGAAMQPLPARRTGGAGFDMGDESDAGHGYHDVAGDTASMRGDVYGAKLGGGGIGGRDSFSGSTAALTGPGYGMNGAQDFGSVPPYYDQYSSPGAPPSHRAASPYFDHHQAVYQADGADLGQNAMGVAGAVPYSDHPPQGYEPEYDYAYAEQQHQQQMAAYHHGQQPMGNHYH